MKTFLKYALVYILLILIFLGSLLAVSYIPKESIKDNIKKSSKVLIYEGDRKFFNSLGRKIFNDNCTDAIMLNLTYTIDENNKLESIIKARRNFIPNVTTEIVSDIVGDLPHETTRYLMTHELLNTANGQKQTSYEYTRYWHGYIVIFRILLTMFDIVTIRIIIQITLFILIFILMYYLMKNSNYKLSIALLVSFIATDLFTWSFVVQGMFVMIIAVAISIFIANKKINEKNINLWLFISGALTAYFDFLTTPLVSVLLPIIIYSAVNNIETTTFKKECIRIIKNLIAWSFGYLGIWSAKWIIADLLYDMDIIKLSLVQIHYRIGGMRDYGLKNLGFHSLMENIINSINCFRVAVYVIIYIYSMLRIKFYKKGYFLSNEKLPYYICLVIPLLWYYVISEHSYQHFFYTYKMMFITMLSILFLVLDDRNKKYIIESKKKEKKND